MVRAGECDATCGEVVNAGTGRDIAVRDLARLAATEDNEIRFIPHDHPQAEIPKLLCDPSKARRLLGWGPSLGLEEGLARTRAWLDANRWAW